MSEFNPNLNYDSIKESLKAGIMSRVPIELKFVWLVELLLLTEFLIQREQNEPLRMNNGNYVITHKMSIGWLSDKTCVNGSIISTLLSFRDTYCHQGPVEAQGYLKKLKDNFDSIKILAKWADVSINISLNDMQLF